MKLLLNGVMTATTLFAGSLDALAGPRATASTAVDARAVDATAVIQRTAGSAQIHDAIGRIGAEYYANGQVRKGRLKQPTPVGGYLCEGWIRLSADGALFQCKLAADATLGAIRLPKGTTVWFYPGGAPRRAWLSRAMVIQGVPCGGGADKSITTCFYADGRLQCTFLSEPFTIQGLPCKKSGLAPVCLYPSGKVEQCTLDKPVKIAGQAYDAGKVLHLNEQGQVVKVEAPVPAYKIPFQILSFNWKKLVSLSR